MNRLIVFRTRDKALSYLTELVELNKDRVANLSIAQLRLAYRNGDVDLAAVIQNERDVDRYRGISVHVLDFKDRLYSRTEDQLRAMVRPLRSDDDTA